MARHLILDAEAVSVLARASEDAKSARRAQAILVSAHQAGTLVRVPAAVLAEVYRGGARDAAVDWVLRRTCEVVPTTQRVARCAGALLAREGLDSAHAIDAFVVATAIRLGGGVIVTHDPTDMSRLAQQHPNVKLAPI